MTATETSLKDVLKENRILSDDTTANQKIHFTLESLEALNASEEQHFWPCIRKSLVSSLVHRYYKKPTSILDIGCGNGSLIRHMTSEFPAATVAGMDGYAEALLNCRKRNPDADLILQDLTKTPWMNTENRYDVVTFMDVLEHLDQPETTLTEAKKLLTEDGIVIISVPARHELWSTRDNFLGHRTRYDKKNLKALVEQSGLKIIHMNYLFSYLYLPMWFNRKVRAKLFNITDDKVEEGELTVLPIINTLVRWIGMTELWLASRIPIPIGTSVYCVAKKSNERTRGSSLDPSTQM